MAVPGRRKGPLGDQHANGPSQGRNALRFDSRRYCALGRSCVIVFNLARTMAPTCSFDRVCRALVSEEASPTRVAAQVVSASAFSAPA
jgi:hypothetical protein